MIKTSFPLRTISTVLISGFMFVACGGSSDSVVATAPLVIPDAPKGSGVTDSAPVADESKVLPYVDFAYTNQRGDARYATLQTNAGVRVVAGFLQLWQPRSLLVDAGSPAAANGSFPAVTASDWTGIPGDATDGKVLNTTIHNANIQYVVDATKVRTPEQELAAYLDDRRNKGYSISDGMGPLTQAWRNSAQQTTTITDIAADATTVRYDDKGNDTGVGSSTNTSFGLAVDFVNNIGENGSTEPAKRFFKYARPWRWNSNVKVVAALEPAKSTTPATDGGYISGHSAEAVRKAIAMAYLVPQCYQEMLARGLELGENRILAGMHSPLDVISGRVQAQAVATASIATGANAKNDLKTQAYQQAQAGLQNALKLSDANALQTYAHSGTAASDRFADYQINKANYLRRLTFGLPAMGDTSKPAVVPKGAEILLETRLPYLDANQRRVVLKTTALPSGYPILDDEEGWGRLNLFAAADAYAAFNGDVSVTMDATKGGFFAQDSWRNDISGIGRLTKLGTGILRLSGNNSYSGGTIISAGTLAADSNLAFGKGDVYLNGGKLVHNSKLPLQLLANYTQLTGSALEIVANSSNLGKIQVAGAVAIDGAASLNLKFAADYKPAAGTVLTILSAKSVGGKFATVTVDGFPKATVTYNADSVTIRLDT